jgi:hypothetical protein
MATIQSIHDVLLTYQQVYGAEALQTQLSLFLKSSSSAPSAGGPSLPSAEKSASSDSPLSKLSNQELRDIWAELTGRKKGLKSSGKLAKKAELIAEIERLRSAPAPSASVVSSEEPAEEEKKSKRSGPSAWNAFVKSVAGEKGSPTAEFLAWKAEHKEEKGNLAFSYAKSLGKEALEAFKSSYVPSAASSVVSDQDDQVSVPSATPSEVSAGSKKKPGRPKMSEEERSAKAEAKKAAKKAEREEKKAAKKAEKAAAKSAKKSPLPALPESDDEEEAVTVFTEVEIGDEPFFWDEKTGALWARDEEGALSQVGNYDGITISFS